MRYEQCAHFLQKFYFKLSMKVYKFPAENEHTGYEYVSAKPPPVVATEPSYYGGHREVYLYL